MSGKPIKIRGFTWTVTGMVVLVITVTLSFHFGFNDRKTWVIDFGAFFSLCVCFYIAVRHEILPWWRNDEERSAKRQLRAEKETMKHFGWWFAELLSRGSAIERHVAMTLSASPHDTPPNPDDGILSKVKERGELYAALSNIYRYMGLDHWVIQQRDTRITRLETALKASKAREAELQEMHETLSKRCSGLRGLAFDMRKLMLRLDTTSMKDLLPSDMRRDIGASVLLELILADVPLEEIMADLLDRHPNLWTSSVKHLLNEIRQGSAPINKDASTCLVTWLGKQSLARGT